MDRIVIADFLAAIDLVKGEARRHPAKEHRQQKRNPEAETAQESETNSETVDDSRALDELV
jgi:hypothetical protein